MLLRLGLSSLDEDLSETLPPDARGEYQRALNRALREGCSPQEARNRAIDHLDRFFLLYCGEWVRRDRLSLDY